MHKFTDMISLGTKCQTAFQIRRHYRNSVASYFDWIGTPHKGLITTLHRNFDGCFERDQLILGSDKQYVYNQETGFTYRHFFSRDQQTGLISIETIDREFAAVRAMLQRRADRWLKRIRSEKLLLIRHADISEHDAKELLKTLNQVAGANSVYLLFVSSPGFQLGLTNPKVFHSPTVPAVSDHLNWQGNNNLWDRVFANFHKQSLSVTRLRQTPVRVNDRSKRIVFQVPVLYSVGHLIRMLAIATRMSECYPGLQILFVIAGRANAIGHLIDFPYIELPGSYTPTATDSLKHLRSFRKRLYADFCKAILDAYKPHLIVYDMFPDRSFLAASIDLGIASSICIKNLRNTTTYLEKPEVCEILSSCVSVIRPHEISDDINIPHLAEKSVFTGAICHVKPELTTYPRPRTPKVVITAGAGGHRTASGFLELAINAFRIAKHSLPHLEAEISLGPLFPNRKFFRLEKDIRVLPLDAAFLQSCAAATLVIAPAGYNLVNELAAIGSPTIAVPQPRTFDNQLLRITQLTQRGTGIRLGDCENSTTLADSIVDALRASPVLPLDFPLKGAENASHHLYSIIEDVISSPR